MGWKQWSAVALVIGGGILLQIPRHDDADMDHAAREHSEMAASMADVGGHFTTVALDVTGMT
ncbi:MAG: hypothetical protein O2956_07500 [Gemmatimonadetes bacterium]|nr:hypothetical protein [Gemmatimonadota bacterium]